MPAQRKKVFVAAKGLQEAILGGNRRSNGFRTERRGVFRTLKRSRARGKIQGQKKKPVFLIH